MAPPPLPSRAASARARALKAERAGDLAAALDGYQAALAETPQDPDALTAVARIAERLEMHAVAAQVWAEVARAAPERLEAVDGQARALVALGRADEGVALLREATLANPQEARLWNALGVALTQDGQTELALTFLDEAVRLDPRLAAALYNRGGARFDLGDLAGAQEDFALARKAARKPGDAAMIDFAAATLMLARGELAAGWDAYEARFSRDLPNPVVFRAPGRRWTPDVKLEGRHLLVLAEQGLGDELMFANLLADVQAALGPDGLMTVAVEPRLVALFQRSFPGARVVAHQTAGEGAARVRSAEVRKGRPVDLWAPLASLTRRFRRSLNDFPSGGGYLTPDPERVARWRAWLGDGPPAVGLSWRSGNVTGERRRHYPPLDGLGPVLAAPGVRFVPIQYGDVAEELPVLAQLSGGRMLPPPDLDLRDDLEGLAALCATLDLVVSVANATGALAGAVGAELAMISGPVSWPKLGTDGYPWYPKARAFAPAGFGRWEPVMAELAAVVAGTAA
jgi:tetratricopeptide (TPR) repeat protein